MSLLYQHAHSFGLDLSPVQLAQFEKYYHLLVEWNARFNLTTLTDYTAVQVKHFLDSLSAAPILRRAQTQNKTLLDVGAGAGFPGMALAIAFPELRVTLLEATGKKVRFLEEVARELPLDNVRAVHGRAEEFAHQAREREHYDFVAARALAPMPTLMEYILPVARVGGTVIAYKAVDAERETADAENAITKLGGRLREIVRVQLADMDDVRHLVVIDKVAVTPPIYPRAGGAPKNKPL